MKVFLLWNDENSYDTCPYVAAIFPSVDAAKRAATWLTETQYGKGHQPSYEGTLDWDELSLPVRSTSAMDGLIMTWRIEERNVQE